MLMLNVHANVWRDRQSLKRKTVFFFVISDLDLSVISEGGSGKKSTGVSVETKLSRTDAWRSKICTNSNDI